MSLFKACKDKARISVIQKLLAKLLISQQQENKSLIGLTHVERRVFPENKNSKGN